MQETDVGHPPRAGAGDELEALQALPRLRHGCATAGLVEAQASGPDSGWQVHVPLAATGLGLEEEVEVERPVIVSSDELAEHPGTGLSRLASLNERPAQPDVLAGPAGLLQQGATGLLPDKR